MVSEDEVKRQLENINVKTTGWGRREFDELPRILLPGEEIYECVNGIYEGGFALLIATDVRVLLIDKKPLNYLTVEDLRFDMINEMDYSHRLIGAFVNIISSGNKNLTFRSYNQQRLRKLIGHVQHCMAEAKKRQSSHVEGQSQHLERINEQLQAYLRAQQEYQLQIQEAQKAGADTQDLPRMPEPPSNELKDYLYAQSLMNQYRQAPAAEPVDAQPAPQAPRAEPVAAAAGMEDLYREARAEIFGKRLRRSGAAAAGAVTQLTDDQSATAGNTKLEMDNPLRIAYAKLPMALRNRKFGRPSFHAHSQRTVPDAS